MICMLSPLLSYIESLRLVCSIIYFAGVLSLCDYALSGSRDDDWSSSDLIYAVLNYIVCVKSLFRHQVFKSNQKVKIVAVVLFCWSSLRQCVYVYMFCLLGSQSCCSFQRCVWENLISDGKDDNLGFCYGKHLFAWLRELIRPRVHIPHYCKIQGNLIWLQLNTLVMLSEKGKWPTYSKTRKMAVGELKESTFCCNRFRVWLFYVFCNY